MKQPPIVFLPPEAFGQNMADMADEDVMFELQSASSWDVATRYHEFKAKPSAQNILKHLRRLSAHAILERAQAILGSVVHPVFQKSAPWAEVPGDAAQVDFDFDETIENSPFLDDIWMEFEVHRPQAIILSVDTSLSMTGEKLALTAVALAVVLLQFPDDPIGIVAFENEAKILKRPEERISIPMLVERFLDVPAQGYTHLEEGMRAALKLATSAAVSGGGRARRASTVLLTDGKYTAGRDPGYLAPRFSHLVVLKMGRERASLELCRELAIGGKGVLREVAELDALPQIMYSVVKDLLRGRS